MNDFLISVKALFVLTKVIIKSAINSYKTYYRGTKAYLEIQKMVKK